MVYKYRAQAVGLGFQNHRPGQNPPQAKHRARLGLAFFGLAWPGFWPQAGAGTSLVVQIIDEPEHSSD